MVFSKTPEITEPRGYVAYDTNECSIDGVSMENGRLTIKSYDLSNICEVRHSYFERIRKTQAKYAKDRRVTKKIQRKLFTKQNNKVNSILHEVSLEIVKQAKWKGQA
ncbi:MAG: hypothetical protein AOA65_0411 [Candidatus Bathyarchaeota archaeon BA1]|nr:MAG: hypothetical protein AOA65_0411 [Candidatus Bathyarchaeota archaeon BA1]